MNRIPAAFTDPEGARHDEATRRAKHEALKLELSQTIHARQSAYTKRSALIGGSSNTALLEQASAEVAQWEKAVTVATEKLASFEATEELRRNGYIGEIVIKLVVFCDQLAAENTASKELIAALERRLAALESAKPSPQA